MLARKATVIDSISGYPQIRCYWRMDHSISAVFGTVSHRRVSRQVCTAMPLH